MSADQKPLLGIPTNVISGFLGVGKTSAILNLLSQKSSHERWAVLVNEFGEIGIDGSLLQNHQSTDSNIFIREVPGGCMCCTAGISMQLALAQLLEKAKPDRLLIEPTGLGHPREVLDILSASYYKEILSIQKTITLVDARKLKEKRFTENVIFTQQITVADIIIGNKIDLYEDSDRESLQNYIAQAGQSHTKIVFSQNGEIPLSILLGPTSYRTQNPDEVPVKNNQKIAISDESIPVGGYVKAMNKAEGFMSVGWRFSSEKVFNHQKLFALLTGLIIDRMKAVFITDNGVFGYNLTLDGLKEIELDDCLESRIELISGSIDESFEEGLFDCIQ